MAEPSLHPPDQRAPTPSAEQTHPEEENGICHLRQEHFQDFQQSSPRACGDANPEPHSCLPAWELQAPSEKLPSCFTIRMHLLKGKAFSVCKQLWEAFPREHIRAAAGKLSLQKCIYFVPALLGHLSPSFSSRMMRSGWKTNGECTSPEPQSQAWAPPAPLSCSLGFIQSQTKPWESICQLNLDLHLRLHLSAPAAALDSAEPSLLEGNVNSENVFFYPVWLLLTVWTDSRDKSSLSAAGAALGSGVALIIFRIIQNIHLFAWCVKPVRNSSPGMFPAPAPGWNRLSLPSALCSLQPASKKTLLWCFHALC